MKADDIDVDAVVYRREAIAEAAARMRHDGSITIYGDAAIGAAIAPAGDAHTRREHQHRNGRVLFWRA